MVMQFVPSASAASHPLIDVNSDVFRGLECLSPLEQTTRHLKFVRTVWLPCIFSQFLVLPSISLFIHADLPRHASLAGVSVSCLYLLMCLCSSADILCLVYKFCVYFAFCNALWTFCYLSILYFYNFVCSSPWMTFVLCARASLSISGHALVSGRWWACCRASDTSAHGRLPSLCSNRNPQSPAALWPAPL